MERDTYTVHEAARLLGKHDQTVRKWIRLKKIPGAEYDKETRFYVIWKQPFNQWRLGERKAA